MQLEIGKVYEGVVKGIMPYGAFVEIDNSVTGMVHISEVANTYVNDIKEHLTENQTVKVKVLSINEAGKISLSIKKAQPPQPREGGPRPRRENHTRPNVWEPKKQVPMSELSFEDMMSRFKQSSEEKICDLKRGSDRKNGSRSRGK
ncbi:MAG: S1 RNA-binding domain-containing protein [Ruminococcus sp.]|nr:S1 RNA-binding domain-containing protein [Ruminococcus sp.]MBQ8906024.1 S1 RNA-binding domain-containing protein [Ruminococcus sp.]